MKPSRLETRDRDARRFDISPVLVFYEITRACDLVCKHCRADAQPARHPLELRTEESMALIDDLCRFPEAPILVLTGGDPFKRADLFRLVDYSVSRGLETALSPSATPLVTRDALRHLVDAGCARMSISLDGADAATHDAMRGVPGTYDHAMRILADARDVGLSVQVNTTLNPHNLDQIEAMAESLVDLRISMWSVFFIIPVGRATANLRLTPEQYEAAFDRLWAQARIRPFAIKTTEAMHYRRFQLQQQKLARAAAPAADPADTSVHPGPPRVKFWGVNDGKGVMFVSHTGGIQPSGFLPVVCGTFPADSAVDVYQLSPTFIRLRDTDQLGGKCGFCEYRTLCGGSRARAYALTGDLMAQEPDCVYLPPRYTESLSASAL